MGFGGARWAVLELTQYLVALSIGDLDEVLSEAAPAAAIQRQKAWDELHFSLSHFLRLQHEIDVLRNVASIAPGSSSRGMMRSQAAERIANSESVNVRYGESVPEASGLEAPAAGAESRLQAGPMSTAPPPRN